jgi:hypothetical protein
MGLGVFAYSSRSLAKLYCNASGLRLGRILEPAFVRSLAAAADDLIPPLQENIPGEPCRKEMKSGHRIAGRNGKRPVQN